MFAFGCATKWDWQTQSFFCWSPNKMTPSEDHNSSSPKSACKQYKSGWDPHDEFKGCINVHKSPAGLSNNWNTWSAKAHIAYWRMCCSELLLHSALWQNESSWQSNVLTFDLGIIHAAKGGGKKVEWKLDVTGHSCRNESEDFHEADILHCGLLAWGIKDLFQADPKLLSRMKLKVVTSNPIVVMNAQSFWLLNSHVQGVLKCWWWWRSEWVR